MDGLYLDHLGRDSFYGLLALLLLRLFRDANFAESYCANNSRNSVGPICWPGYQAGNCGYALPRKIF